MGFMLKREKTGSTPYVLIDEDQGYMRFEGESFHENAIDFFEEINNWIKVYMKSDFQQFTFDCKLHYFNSSTAKILVNMLMYMDRCVDESKKVTVNWIAAEDNEIIIECGEDFADEVKNLDFQIVLC